MFAFRYMTEFSYDVDADQTISIAKSELKKLEDHPSIIEAVFHFVNDVAAKGTAYTVYIDVEKNKLGRVRLSNRTVFLKD